MPGDYGSSPFDSARLRNFARKVARERAAVGEPGPWLLESRHWSKTVISAKLHDTSKSEYRYWLDPDGSLRLEIESWTETWHREYGNNEFDRSTRDIPMDDEMLLVFDRERSVVRTSSGGVKVDSTIEPTGRIRVHSKGVGMSLKLKRLLETGSTR